MGLSKKDREILVCQLVAEAINLADGTDYLACPSHEEPPDVEFVSESGRYARRPVEVVITPHDHTIRYDNKNAQHFELTLHAALSRMGVSQCQVTVKWTESAMRSGADDRLIVGLAELLAHEIETKNHWLIDGTELYKYSPEISYIVHYVSAYHFDFLRLTVNSAHSWWAPHDGRWIEDALAKKARKYDARSASGMTLVIDGLAHLDREQIDAFRATSDFAHIPFNEVWAVSMGKVYRIKP